VRPDCDSPIARGSSHRLDPPPRRVPVEHVLDRGHPAVRQSIDRDDLDALARACEAGSDTWITLSGRCHPGAPSTCRVPPSGPAVVACAACTRPFARLEVGDLRGGDALGRHPDCGPGSRLDEVRLSYALGSGLVRVACARCGRSLGAIPILRRPR
jgi:hypothetical protein